MGYVLGLDGGGTKTDLLLFTTDGRLMAHVRGGSTNHEHFRGGFEEMFPVLDGMIHRALQQAGIAMGDIAAGVFGMAGIDIPSQKERMERHLKEMGLTQVLAVNDAFLGIKAGCEKGYGVCCVHGTGNAFAGIDPNGRWLQVGGTGFCIGDLPGAGGMAREILYAIYGQFYAMMPPTSMSEKLFQRLGITDPGQLVEALYAQYYTGKLQPKDVIEILYQSVEEGDPAAAEVLDRIADRLARSLAGCIANLDFGQEVDIVLIGSANLKGKAHLLTERYRQMTQRYTGKRCRTIPLHLPPAAGAVLWALEKVHGAVSPELRNRVIAELTNPSLSNLCISYNHNPA